MQDKLKCLFGKNKTSKKTVHDSFFGYFGCLLRIKADQVDFSFFFWVVAREFLEASGLLVHPIKDPTTDEQSLNKLS